jgi:hypothetical protein
MEEYGGHQYCNYTVGMTDTEHSLFWDVAPCSLVDIDRRFRGAYSSIINAMVSAWGPATLTEFFRGFPQSLQENAGIAP